MAMLLGAAVALSVDSSLAERSRVRNPPQEAGVRLKCEMFKVSVEKRTKLPHAIHWKRNSIRSNKYASQSVDDRFK